MSFTHHDPLEDTESSVSGFETKPHECFTHHDPLEDTERQAMCASAGILSGVSPITIRLRILKALLRNA